MKIELKNIKYCNALSRDSIAFTANLYVEGKHIAFCEDDGDGGCVKIDANDGCRSLLEDTENYVKQLPKDTENDLNMNLELYVSGLIYENLIEVELNKTLRKHEKDHVIYGKTKLDTERMYYIGSQKIKISIDKLLSIPQYKEKLIKDMTGLIKEGFTIFNTNIPKELINSIYTINKKSNN